MRPVEPLSYVSSADLPVLIDLQERTESDGVRIAVFGDLDRLGGYPLERAVIHVLREQRPAHLELDLAGVPFLDTGGIRILLQCLADARQLDCRLTLTNVQAEVYRVLGIVGLLEGFGLVSADRSSSSDRPDRSAYSSRAVPSAGSVGAPTASPTPREFPARRRSGR